MVDKKYGVWNIAYNHVPTVGKFNTISSHEQVIEASIEKQLELHMFKEANEVINRAKWLK